MGLLIAVIGVWYTHSVWQSSLALGETAPPNIALAAVATAMLIAGAVISHIVIAVFIIIIIKVIIVFVITAIIVFITISHLPYQNLHHNLFAKSPK